MRQKFINTYFFSFLLIIFASCSHEIICYQVSRCNKKYRLSVLIQDRDSGNISVIFKNSSLRRIGPIDSLHLIFYHYNLNLRQPTFDSTLTTVGDFVEGMDYDEPAVFYSRSYSNSLTIKSGRVVETEIPLESLLIAVSKFGNRDNKLQVKSEFQIFWEGFRKGKMVYHLPSSFFKIKNKRVFNLNRTLKVRFDNQ